MVSSTADFTRLDKMERWIRNQRLLSILILISLGVIGTAEFVQKGSELLVNLGLKKEKRLQLAEDNAKGDLSRRLTELAWRRIFWTQNYLAKMRLKRPQSELDYSWNKHLDTVADWSSEYMVNLNGLQKFYPGTAKARQFEEIHQSLADLEQCRIVHLRLQSSEQSERSVQLQGAFAILDQINTDLYFFVLNEAPSGSYKTIPHEEICPGKK
jgi:hypothetical protein